MSNDFDITPEQAIKLEARDREAMRLAKLMPKRVTIIGRGNRATRRKNRALANKRAK